MLNWESSFDDSLKTPNMAIYEYFNVAGEKYCFSADSLEIVQLSPGSNCDDVVWRDMEDSSIQTDRSSFSSDIIGINLVSGCNLACEYCYLSAYRKEIKKLDLAQLESILRFISERSQHPKTIYFIGGGEPTLNFEILRLVPALCDKYGIKGVRFSLTTNGTLLNEEMLQFFKSNSFDLNISLDGDRYETDSFRKYKNGRGVFLDVFKNIEMLKSYDIPFTCKALLQPKNDILKTFMFFETQQIEFAIDFANESFDGYYRTEPQDIELLKQKLAKVAEYYARKSGGGKIYCASIRAGLSRIHKRLKNITACRSVYNGYNIDLDGKIYTCSMGAGNEKLMIGDILNGIDYQGAIKRKCYPESVELKDSCTKCWAKYLCSGGCFALNLIKTGYPDSPDLYRCEVEKAYWTFIINLYILLHPLVNKNRMKQ